MSELDKLIQEGEEHLKDYEETKESLLSNSEIPAKIKEIHIGLGEALSPILKLLYEQKENNILKNVKNEQPG
jgi:hypothetical protein